MKMELSLKKKNNNISFKSCKMGSNLCGQVYGRLYGRCDLENEVEMEIYLGFCVGPQQVHCGYIQHPLVKKEQTTHAHVPTTVQPHNSASAVQLLAYCLCN